jgi:hypothetical protein
MPSNKDIKLKKTPVSLEQQEFFYVIILLFLLK